MVYIFSDGRIQHPHEEFLPRKLNLKVIMPPDPNTKIKELQSSEKHIHLHQKDVIGKIWAVVNSTRQITQSLK